jgi:hypothetical protein
MVNAAASSIAGLVRWATGGVRFLSSTEAAFTGNAGRTVTFKLQTRNESFPAYCQPFAVGDSVF